MSDKNQAILHIFTQPVTHLLDNNEMVSIETFIANGYSTKMVFRDDPATDFLVFDSLTGLSQIHGTLSQELKQIDMTRLERKFYNADF